MKIFLNEKFIIGLIILNSLIIFMNGFEIPEFKILNLVDDFITLIFLIEVLYKIKNTENFFRSNWNLFDLTLVVLSIPSMLYFIDLDLSNLLILRTLRIFKVFRFFKFIPNIERIISGFERALKSSLFILTTFTIILFIFGMISHSLFNYSDDFKNPIISIYSVIKVFTIEGWYEFPEKLTTDKNDFTSFFIHLYFISILLIGGILGISLINSIFVDSMINNSNLESKVDRLLEKMGGDGNN